jgi:hypothetical protein
MKMGIQIYIKTSALDAKGIEIVRETYKETYRCHCGCTEEGHCGICGGNSVIHEDTVAKVDGLPVMGTLDNDFIWHDANRWGSSRAPILEFIDKHGLIDNDWFEA